MSEPSPPVSRRVELYDTTLRDGTQGLGVALSLKDKLNIARLLDALGFDYIEGGYPLSNPKDVAFFLCLLCLARCLCARDSNRFTSL